MADGENSGAVEAWRPGAVSMIHVVFGIGLLACTIMAVLTVGA